MEIISRIELIEQLKLTPKQFEVAVKAAGLPVQNSYTLNEAARIDAAVVKPKGEQMTRKTQDQARGELAQLKSDLATQSAQAGYQEGTNLATVSTKALIRGYQDTSIQHLRTLAESIQSGRVALTGTQAESWIYDSVGGEDFLSLSPEDLVL